MVLRLISCSPRRRIRLVTVIRGLKACRSPVGLARLREFNTSNGCQNHTALPSAFVRLRAIRQLTGLVDPPCHPLTSPDAIASTASRPAFVTTRDPPLLSERDGDGYRSDLGQPRTEIFLRRGLDRILADGLICPSGKITGRLGSKKLGPPHPESAATFHFRTANKPADIACMIDMGVDRIISDYPEIWRKVAGEKGAPLPAGRPTTPYRSHELLEKHNQSTTLRGCQSMGVDALELWPGWNSYYVG
jgi:hypothetical protein